MAASSSTSRSAAAKAKAAEDEAKGADGTDSDTETDTPEVTPKDIAENVTVTEPPAPSDTPSTDPVNSNPDVPVDVPDETTVPTDDDLAVKQAEIARVRAECEALKQRIQTNAENATRVRTASKLDDELAALRAQRDALASAATDSAKQVVVPVFSDSSIKGGDRATLGLALEAQIAQERAVDVAQAEAPEGVTVEFPHPADDPSRSILVENDLVTKDGRLRAVVKQTLGLEGTN